MGLCRLIIDHLLKLYIMASSLQGLLKSTPVPGLEGREGIYINEYSMYNYYCVLHCWSTASCMPTDHVMFIAFLINSLNSYSFRLPQPK